MKKEKKLYKFQEEALNTVKDRDNAALFWTMGTGKTFSSIQLTEHYDSKILVVVVLKSTTAQWIEELENSTDRKVFNAYRKCKKDGINSFIRCGDRKALVIGYDAFKTKGVDNLRKYISNNAEDVTMVLDESSLIGNNKSKRTKAVKFVKAKHKIMLSGTPCSGGRLEAMVPTMNILGDDITEEEFLKEYCHTIKWTNPTKRWITVDIITGYKNIDQLRKRLQDDGGSFLTMEEAGVQLPEAQEIIIKHAVQREYKTFMKNRVVVTKNGDELVGSNSLTRLLYARQLCSMYNSEKLDAVHDLLQQAEDEPVIIFYNFKKEFEQLKALCEDMKKPISVVNGETRDLTAYEKDKPGTVILAQYRAASMGLNLQKCRISIFYSLCLSYSDYDQAKARTHRIGQNKNCLFYILTAENSVEESIYDKLKEKQSYTEQLFTEEYGDEINSNIDNSNIHNSNNSSFCNDII